MKKCPNCNSLIADDSSSCRFCGQPLGSVETVSQDKNQSYSQNDSYNYNNESQNYYDKAFEDQNYPDYLGFDYPPEEPTEPLIENSVSPNPPAPSLEIQPRKRSNKLLIIVISLILAAVLAAGAVIVYFFFIKDDTNKIRNLNNDVILEVGNKVYAAAYEKPNAIGVAKAGSEDFETFYEFEDKVLASSLIEADGKIYAILRNFNNNKVEVATLDKKGELLDRSDLGGFSDDLEFYGFAFFKDCIYFTTNQTTDDSTLTKLLKWDPTNSIVSTINTFNGVYISSVYSDIKNLYYSTDNKLFKINENNTSDQIYENPDDEYIYGFNYYKDLLYIDWSKKITAYNTENTEQKNVTFYNTDSDYFIYLRSVNNQYIYVSESPYSDENGITDPKVFVEQININNYDEKKSYEINITKDKFDYDIVTYLSLIGVYQVKDTLYLGLRYNDSNDRYIAYCTYNLSTEELNVTTIAKYNF